MHKALENRKYEDLLEMQSDLTVLLKQFKKVRIGKRYSRCGKGGCSCGQGPADNSWGNLHGPYVVAKFVDCETGKYRVVSLGVHYAREDREALIEKSQQIEWFSFFKITPPEKQKMPLEEQACLRVYFLTSSEFFAFYGLKMSDDKLDRYRKYYGTVEGMQSFEEKKRRRRELVERMQSSWAVNLGIGSKRGQAKLKNILSGAYYLAED